MKWTVISQTIGGALPGTFRFEQENDARRCFQDACRALGTDYVLLMEDGNAIDSWGT